MTRKVLITGGAGYIGSHTAVELLAAGYDVVLVDSLVNSSVNVVEAIRRIAGVEVPFVEVDCSDRVALGRVFERWRFDAVIHFAALKSVPESVREPLRYYRNNVESLITLLDVMGDRGVSGIVFSSSASVYGEPVLLPANENTPRMAPTSPYGATKQVCEDILRDVVAASFDAGSTAGLQAISLRYFNPVGQYLSASDSAFAESRQSAATPGGGLSCTHPPLASDFAAKAPDNIVPIIARVAREGGELSIFGGDYPTPDGTALRDYVDVGDLARAHVAAVGRLGHSCVTATEGDGGDNCGGGYGCQKASYEVFNIGSGRAVSVLELVREFEAATGLAVPYKIVERRAGDPSVLWADVSLAARELGWRPERSLAESLRSVV